MTRVLWLPLLVACSSPGVLPDGVDHTYVQIADGNVDIFNNPTLVADVAEDWSGMTHATIRAEAEAFFLDRFGLDATDPVLLEKAIVLESAFGPTSGYRIVWDPEQDVPPEGWPVLDLPIAIMATAPEGVTLGGDFNGVTMGPGSMVIYGYYIIQTPDEDLLVPFKSAAVSFAGPMGETAGACEVDHPWYGVGSANYTSMTIPKEDGSMDVDVRNTFIFR